MPALMAFGNNFFVIKSILLYTSNTWREIMELQENKDPECKLWSRVRVSHHSTCLCPQHQILWWDHHLGLKGGGPVSEELIGCSGDRD
jgi:hypothetical protein